MLTPFEIARVAAEPTLPNLYRRARSELKRLTRPGSQLLDIGGRRSPYTVGLPASITVFDRPRESAVQHALGLGIDDDVLAKLKRRRSNIEAVVFGDMTDCQLPSDSYDGVIAVEVIEHVADDESFVHHMARVLRPGGWAYLTTPNGDFIANTNPDHVRHYKRHELAALLSRHFEESRVCYGVATTENWRRGLRSFDVRHPLTLVSTMLSNVMNHRESRGIDDRASQTAHLFAIARKRG